MTERTNETQRQRRAKGARVDYYPTPEALAFIDSLRAGYLPWNNYTGILNAILADCVASGGLKKREITQRTARSAPPMPEFLHAYARANDFGAGVRKSCGARTKAGTACGTQPLPGKCRCKWHGGCSTGPRTAEGKAKALANLRQYHRESSQ